MNAPDPDVDLSNAENHDGTSIAVRVRLGNCPDPEIRRKSFERLIELLRTRTGKLQDVLSVERELARVREEIERIEGRLRYFKANAELSTLSVSLHEPTPIVATQGRGPIGEAFREAWRNFVALLAAGIASLGYLVPVLALGWGAVAVGRRWRKPAAA